MNQIPTSENTEIQNALLQTHDLDTNTKRK